MLRIVVLLLLRCVLAWGFTCSPAAVQALAGRSNGFVSPHAGLGPHEHQRKVQHREQRPSILPSPRGISSTRRTTSSSRVPRASASSSSSHDQGLQQPLPRLPRAATPPPPPSQLDDLLLPQVSGGSTDRSTLGIDRRVLQQTVVPRLAGAITKESPLDFVVVEIPQQAASKFTPADPEEPVPKEARKPVVHRVSFRQEAWAFNVGGWVVGPVRVGKVLRTGRAQ